MKFNLFSQTLLVLAGSIVLFSSCKKQKVKDKKAEYVENVSNIAYNAYLDSYNTAVELKDAIDAFVANPTSATHETAKEKWLTAREAYGITEVFRFQDGPIDDEDGPEGALNAWPLDEAYIDYVDGDPNAGLVNNTSVTIDPSTLRSKNEVGGEKNISIGYHAIEFLLWGQDDPNTSLKTPGDRPYTDYVTGGSGTASNQDRRGAYLKICAEILVEDLNGLVQEWKEGGSYRTTFTSMESDDAIAKILTGMGVLSKGELAGERMFVALDNADQEDEHSCFSDNTDRDVILNAQGIYNLYFGEMTKIDGTVISGASLEDILEINDKDTYEEYSAVFENTLADVKKVPDPFDYALTQESVGGDGPIMTAIESLQNQGDEIVNIASDLGLTVSNELPE